MKIRPLFFLLLLLSCTSSPVVQNRFSHLPLREVHEAADQRNAEALEKFMRHQDPLVRAEAALCAGSIQDTMHVELLKKMMTDEDVNIRRNAAFALGQSGDEKAIGFLVSGYRHQTDSEVMYQILVAIGKLYGDPGQFTRTETIHYNGFMLEDEVDSVREFLLDVELNDERVKEGYGVMVQHFHRKKLFEPEYLRRMKFALQTSRHESRVAMTAAMASYEGAWLKDNADYFVQWMNQERDVDVKFHLVRICGKINHPKTNPLLRGYASARNTDIRINLAAIEALQKIKTTDAQVFMDCLGHENDQVVAAALDALENPSVKADLHAVREKIQNRSAYIQAKGLALSLLKAPSTPTDPVFEKIATEKNRYAQSFYIQALRECDHCTEALTEMFYQATDAVILGALTETLIYQQKKKKWKSETPFETFLIKAIQKNDDGVADQVVSELSGLALSEEKKNEIGTALEDARKKLVLPKQTEIYNRITDLRNQWYNTSEPHAKIDFSQKIDWDFVATLSANDYIELETGKGIIKMQLKVDDAPGSVAFIAKLVEDGFYNRKTFHRIVPNFVAQGGCPVGNGMGGTDYPIRSEFSLLQFHRGSVGLASAGKDTESCQFFINYRETPHLDGHYTVFAEVMEGMDVIDSLIIGDEIISAKLVRVSYN